MGECSHNPKQKKPKTLFCYSKICLCSLSIIDNFVDNLNFKKGYLTAILAI